MHKKVQLSLSNVNQYQGVTSCPQEMLKLGSSKQMTKQLSHRAPDGQLHTLQGFQPHTDQHHGIWGYPVAPHPRQQTCARPDASPMQGGAEGAQFHLWLLVNGF